MPIPCRLQPQAAAAEDEAPCLGCHQEEEEEVEAEEVESRSRGHGDGEPEALPGEPVHHRREREAPGEGQRAPPREPRPAPEPVQDGGRGRAAGGRSGSWSCVRLLPLAAEHALPALVLVLVCVES